LHGIGVKLDLQAIMPNGTRVQLLAD